MISQKQLGVALITVMLILSLATITAVSMVSRQNIDIHRSANILNFDQAIEITILLENYAKQALITHFVTNNNSTISSVDIDNWNQRAAVGISVNEIDGKGGGYINDTQARFNLNSLVDGNDNVAPLQRARLETLINNLNQDENLNLNINFVEALIDWIDRNQGVTGANGAEDGEYSSYDPPYSASNQYMVDISELLLVKGIEYESYKILKKYVCVLDPAALMNINTASEQVLRSLDQRITPDIATALYTSARTTEFATPADFRNDPNIARLNINIVGLDVSSNYFILESEVNRNDSTMRYTSSLYRPPTGNIDVIKRIRSFL